MCSFSLFAFFFAKTVVFRDLSVVFCFVLSFICIHTKRDQGEDASVIRSKTLTFFQIKTGIFARGKDFRNLIISSNLGNHLFPGRLCSSSSSCAVFLYGHFLLDVNRGNLLYLFVVKGYNVSNKVKICHGMSWGEFMETEM